MQLLARAPQKAAVGRILHQRMFESIVRVGRFAALEDQLGTDKARERGL